MASCQSHESLWGLRALGPGEVEPQVGRRFAGQSVAEVPVRKCPPATVGLSLASLSLVLHFLWRLLLAAPGPPRRGLWPFIPPVCGRHFGRCECSSRQLSHLHVHGQSHLLGPFLAMKMLETLSSVCRSCRSAWVLFIATAFLYELIHFIQHMIM